MSDLIITVWDGKEPDFWSVIGPIATNERIITALRGKPITHALGKTWIIAESNGRTIGFATMSLNTGKAPFVELLETYVDPLYAGGRVAQLMSERKRSRFFDSGSSGGMTPEGGTAAALAERRLLEAFTRWPTLPVRVTIPIGEPWPDLEARGFREVARTKRTITLELRWSEAAAPVLDVLPARPPEVVVKELEGDDIFRVLGRFAMDHDVNKSLALCLIHTEKKRWFVAMLGREIGGFACVEAGRTDTIHLRHSYVVPAHRGKGVYRALLLHRLGIGAGKRILTTATKESRPILERHGFIPDPEVRQRGQYTILLLDLREKTLAGHKAGKQEPES